MDGIAGGFVTDRTDFGNFGRAEPVAVPGTIGVDPDYAYRGVGHALLSQLFVNLEGLSGAKPQRRTRRPRRALWRLAATAF